jgi:hypothetical protein
MKPRTLRAYAAAFAIVGLTVILISYVAMVISYLPVYLGLWPSYDIPGFLIQYQTWWAMWNPSIQTIILLVILISIAWTAYKRN